MAVILNIEMPECCDQCLFGCWSNLHQTAECYLMGDTQMFDDFSTEYKTMRSVNCPMKEHKPMVERKNGRWIDCGFPDEVFAEVMKCPFCGSESFGGNFCDYCGADMRGGGDD